MPIIDHANAREVPWRPNYRKWQITEDGDGTTSTDASLNEVGVGAGAPLHTHEDDELLVVLEGTLRVRIGDESHDAGADHTVVVPPGVPHGFEAVGRLTGAGACLLPIQRPVPADQVPGGRPAGV